MLTTTGFAPRKDFETILKWAVIPTLDVVAVLPCGGVVMARRTIAPYRDTWALPGLRMLKGEGIHDTLRRIVHHELNMDPVLDESVLIGQFVGRFKTEFSRQDLSTCYAVPVTGDLSINISSHRVIRALDDIPLKTGAMYRHYLSTYFSRS